MIRSATEYTWKMLWSMKTADLPAVRIPSTNVSSFSVSLSERPIVGSSRMMISASKWSARTMGRPWGSPPDRPGTVGAGVRAGGRARPEHPHRLADQVGRDRAHLGGPQEAEPAGERPAHEDVAPERELLRQG